MNTRFSSALHLQNLLKLRVDVHQREGRQRATHRGVQPPDAQPHTGAVDREAEAVLGIAALYDAADAAARRERSVREGWTLGSEQRSPAVKAKFEL